MTRRAQSALEYFFLIIIFTFGLFAMQVYLKRAAQGWLKGSMEQLSDGIFYSPSATFGRSQSVTDIEETTDSQSLIDPVTNTGTSDILTISTIEMHQSANREERVLSFGSEPRRWQ
ncbi:MAG: hypothetical protein A3G38_02025 [Omnitrophica WOR_2 bacterium RIFCSPLOWO2_12_FULL_51_8]|nr:MAG: hypothetical protein A3G38_02025 [Omnitrophica WOR_2 bacterium RIFCSPLOWO2_12_FULL_51_8]